MSKFKDVTGKKIGRLTVLYRLNNYHKKGVYWKSFRIERGVMN